MIDVSGDYIDIAEALLHNQIDISEDPICRAIINRSYYAVFNKIRKECEYLGINTEQYGGGSHINTINLFFDYLKKYPELKKCAQIATKDSITLSKHRQNADYHKNDKNLDFYVSKNNVIILVNLAKKVIGHIDFMINKLDSTNT